MLLPVSLLAGEFRQTHNKTTTGYRCCGDLQLVLSDHCCIAFAVIRKCTPHPVGTGVVPPYPAIASHRHLQDRETGPQLPGSARPSSRCAHCRGVPAYVRCACSPVFPVVVNWETISMHIQLLAPCWSEPAPASQRDATCAASRHVRACQRLRGPAR